MPIEVVTFISDLNPSNPVGSTDKVQTLDDHARNIKLALRNTFPNVTGAITLTHTDLNDAARKSQANTFTAALQTVAAAGARLVLQDGALSGRAWASLADGAFLVGTTTPHPMSVMFNGAPAIVVSANSLAGISLAGVAASDFARLSQENRFTVTQHIEAANPMLRFKVTGAPADQKYWNIEATNNAWALETLTDALGFGQGPIALTRSGTTVTSMALAANSITLNGVSAADFARLSQANVFNAASQTFTNGSGNVVITPSGGTNTIGTDGAWGFGIVTTNVPRLVVSNAGNFDFKAGTVTTNNANAAEVGFKGVPIVDTSVSYTTQLADAGKCIAPVNAGLTITIAGGTYPDGTTLSFLAWHACSIAISGGEILQLAGTASTGTRTLAANGTATAIKRANIWFISGAGLS